MVFEHDFHKFPELTNTQLQTLEFISPHKQIKEDFRATVVRVHDGDTISLRAGFRDFEFPLRILEIDAPELNQKGGNESRDWLHARIIDKEVDILINPQQRVGKYGRLLGKIVHGGMNVGDEMLRLGFALPFERRFEGALPNINKELRMEKWL